jgi:nitrate reductase gamma subunit
MDILGNGPPAERARAGAEAAPERATGDPVDWDAEPDLDLDAPEEEPEPAARRRPLADLVSAESLAVAGLAVGVTSMTGPAWMTMLMFSSSGNPGTTTEQRQLQLYATLHGAAAALTLVLGVTALLRRPPTGPAWVRALAGAATILGLLLAVVALVLLQRSLGMPDTTDTGTFGG